jgi:predicted GNAT superfamily acetyltransferase
VSVQIEGAAPLRRALEEGQLFSRVENIPDSKAEAILAEESFSSPIAIQALLQTDGEVIEVSDSELHVWQQRLRKDFQIVSEFSSAAAFAALHKLELSPNDIVAVVNTATGMRDLVQQLKIQGAMEPTTNRRQTGEQNQSVEKVQARVLTTLDELADCENLQAAAFGFEDREITPREVLSVIQQTGGLIVGVYEGPNLVAFSSAFLSRDSKGLFLHSDLAAVQPDLQSQGLGKILKEAQREFALQMGFERIRWTYDPMLTKNANLNIKKLGGCAVEFKRDVYGQSSSELYANLPTHRLVIEWDLKSNPEARDIPQDAAIALQNIGGSPSVSQVPMGSSAVVAEVPLNYLSIKDQSIKKAAQWQDEFARTAEGLFALGYVINGFERDDQRQAGRYLFSKREL